MDKIIDLRSDTSSLPTPEMLDAIKSAKLGNDGYGEDPTVNHLQVLAAEKVGKEAALFFPSGTQANLASLLCHTSRGYEVVAERDSHIVTTEAGYSVFAGLMLRPIGGKNGSPSPEELEEALLTPKHLGTGVFCLENTHNRAGGTIVGPEHTARLAGIAHKYHVPVHLDGARIFNAAVALRIDPTELTRNADSVMIDLSKGLCAPVGSLLTGTKEFIKDARKIRRILGGQMRQVGVLAACGIIALEKMIDRLSEDHENALFLAKELSGIEGVQVRPETVQTNIVFVDISATGKTASWVADRLRERGVLVDQKGKFIIRFVTHKDTPRNDVALAVASFKSVIERGN